MTLDKRFQDLRVADVHEIISTKPSKVSKSATLRQAIDSMLSNPISHRVYVVDTEGNLAGMISMETLLRHIGYRTGVRENSAMAFIGLLRESFKERVEQVMDNARPVKESTPLRDALYLMLDNHMTDLPVVDDDFKLIGELCGIELLTAARGLFPESTP